MGGIFSTTNKRLSAPGRSREKMNKSEDTLDSLKRDSVTDSSESEDEESVTGIDDDTDEESEASPVAASGKKRVGKSGY